MPMRGIVSTARPNSDALAEFSVIKSSGSYVLADAAGAEEEREGEEDLCREPTIHMHRG